MSITPRHPNGRPQAQALAESSVESWVGLQESDRRRFRAPDRLSLRDRSWQRWPAPASARRLAVSRERWLAWVFLNTKRSATRARSKEAIFSFPFTLKMATNEIE